MKKDTYYKMDLPVTGGKRFPKAAKKARRIIRKELALGGKFNVYKVTRTTKRNTTRLVYRDSEEYPRNDIRV